MGTPEAARRRVEADFQPDPHSLWSGTPAVPAFRFRHAGNFLLKGALLFQLWYGHPHRPTQDADLLGFGPDDVPTLVEMFRSVAEIPVDDGIVFDPATTKGSEIRKDAGYGGVRIDLRATLDGARIALQVDIGFGDAVTPGAQVVTYPTLLPDVPGPMLRAYPKATVVAEKTHAIATTFARRQTAVPEVLPIGFSEAFAQDAAKQLQWRAFLNRNRLDALDLSAVLLFVRTRLQAVDFPHR